MVELQAACLGEVEQATAPGGPACSTKPRSARSAPSRPGSTSPRACGAIVVRQLGRRAAEHRQGGVVEQVGRRRRARRGLRQPLPSDLHQVGGLRAKRRGRASREARSPAASPRPASAPSAVRASWSSRAAWSASNASTSAVVGAGVGAAKPRHQPVDRLGAVLVEREGEERDERARERRGRKRPAHSVAEATPASASAERSPLSVLVQAWRRPPRSGRRRPGPQRRDHPLGRHPVADVGACRLEPLDAACRSRRLGARTGAARGCRSRHLASSATAARRASAPAIHASTRSWRAAKTRRSALIRQTGLDRVPARERAQERPLDRGEVVEPDQVHRADRRPRPRRRPSPTRARPARGCPPPAARPGPPCAAARSPSARPRP